MPKRYVLLESGTDLGEEDFRRLGAFLSEKIPGSKTIQLEGCPRFAIVKTTNAGAPALREEGVRAGGLSLRPVLTSGNIGKLKRRAAGGGAKPDGEVPQ